jgi:hypothetical protein
VTVGRCTTCRTDPTFVSSDFIAFQSKTMEPITSARAETTRAPPIATTAPTQAANTSLRVIISHSF